VHREEKDSKRKTYREKRTNEGTGEQGNEEKEGFHQGASGCTGKRKGRGREAHSTSYLRLGKGEEEGEEGV
jgi:hypothetical protein